MVYRQEEAPQFLPPDLADAAEVASLAYYPALNPNAPFLGVTDDIEVAPNLAACMNNRRTVVSAAYADGKIGGKMIGFDLAVPIGVFDPRRREPDIAYLYFTAVHPDHRGQGLVWGIHHDLFERLREQGYTKVEVDVVVGNTYADRFQAWSGAEVLGPDLDKYGFGPERPLRVDLDQFFARPKDLLPTGVYS